MTEDKEKLDQLEHYLNDLKKDTSEKLYLDETNYGKLLFAANGAGAIALLAATTQLRISGEKELAIKLIEAEMFFIYGLIVILISLLLTMFLRYFFINQVNTIADNVKAANSKWLKLANLLAIPLVISPLFCFVYGCYLAANFIKT